MRSGNENEMKELFGRFVGSEEANRAADDVRKGEQILCDYPAPEPDKEVIVRLKAEIPGALARRKIRAIKRLSLSAAAVAAVVTIATVISVTVFEKKEPESEKVVATVMIPTISWESDTLATDDAEIATIISEVEQIESELVAMELGENSGNGQIDSTDLEMELVEIDSDFWKG